MKTPRLAAGIVLLALGLVAGTAQAETTDCTQINSLPAVVSTQGVHCLKGNLATSSSSGAAIEITVNNVTIDLNGWKVGGQGAGSATEATGIYSTANNVTIRNGIVKGFRVGVWLTGRGAKIEDMLLDLNTYTGIWAGGDGALLRRNQIVSTGGSTGSSAYDDAFGIYVAGVGSLVDDNLVSGLNGTSDGDEYGIYLGAAADNSIVRGNVIADSAAPPGAGQAVGIRMGNTSRVSVVDNAINYFDIGIRYFGVASGVYLYRLETAVSSDVKRKVLLK